MYWWINHGDNVWTGPFLTESESLRYGHHILGSYECGSNCSMSFPGILDDSTDKNESILASDDLYEIRDELSEIEKTLIGVLKDLDTILEGIFDTD